MSTDWITAKLKDCFNLKSGDGLTAKKMVPGDYDVFGGNGVAGKHNDFNLSGDNVIVGRVGALCGNARHITEDIWLTDNAFRITKPMFEFDNKFLTYLLNYKNLRSLARHAAQPVISNSSLADLELSFPNSIEEQKRIVAILDQAFADIEKARTTAETNMKNGRELFDSYLQKVFSQEGEGWETIPLQSLSNIINGYAFKSGDFSPQNEAKSIKITNVGVYEFVEETSNFLPKEFTEEYKRYKAFEGDLVIALTRTIISSGLKVAVVPASYDGALVNQRVAAVQVNEQLLPKEILQAFLSTKIATDYVKANVNELMQPNLSIKDLKAFPVPVPPKGSLEEILKGIVLIKEKTSRLSNVYLRKIEVLDELKKSILQKAFTGQLTKSKGIAA
ncbi:hypothetical protein PI2015_0342 [Pseudoalteromonas issachenkonii]|uniref:Type I restriction enzyme, S subunit n=1 Tax=Pseudoalteromonas issachenkonii TaxID=152297 RepID=A0ABM6MZS7_9GAMM|nr:restriction endonuclease subunit S [Pseudoalteromonas issachenkonii]ALQ53670.1 hypothetical protein PI2015_0342 [Pseudoalteromonas issachenkonii]ATC89425.1 type I restriction enzyme, S subunit [Pseudoalteromonas issachenkonii]